MIRAALVLFPLLLLQEGEEAAARFAREVDRHRRATADAEVRERLARVEQGLRKAARSALLGPTADPERPEIRIYSITALVTGPDDKPSLEDLLRFGEAPAFEESHGLFNLESFVDYLKERCGPGLWEGENTMEMTPALDLLVQAPPRRQRQIARLLEILEGEARRQVRITIAVLASRSPRIPELSGEPADGAFEALLARAAEGKEVQRLARFDLGAQVGHIVSASSSVKTLLHSALEEGRPSPRPVSEGTFVQAAVTGAGIFEVDVRVGYRQLLGLDEVATPQGMLQLPRVAEARLLEVRSAPDGRWVLLGRLGPLPDEAKVPPHLIVLGRFSSAP